MDIQIVMDPYIWILLINKHKKNYCYTLEYGQISKNSLEENSHSKTEKGVYTEWFHFYKTLENTNIVPGTEQ